MKNKQTLKLAIAVIVLLVALGAYVGVKYWNRSETAKAEEQSDTSIALTDLTGDEITKFSYQYENETYTFIKEDGNWYNDADRSFPVKQSSIEGKLSSAVSTTATRELTADDAALAEYGLDAPANTITLTDGDGHETVFEIGDMNASTSEYYCRLNRSDKVYMISSSLNSMMSFDIYTVADMQSFPYIDSADIKALSVDDGTTVKDYDPTDDSAAYTAISSLYYTSHVDYNCTDLSQYGLDQPKYTITVKYVEEAETEETETADTATAESSSDTETEAETKESYDEADLKQLVLYVGNATDSGYYVRVEGSNEVHIMAASLLEGLL